MGIITDIKVAKGNKKRQHIYIDDEFVCTVDEFTAFKNHLKVGLEIDCAALEQITLESESSTAFERAIDLISNTPKTKKQIKDYLYGKGYLPAVVNSVVEKMLEYHYLDDVQYARMYVDAYKNKFGKQKLRFNLQAKGVSGAIVNEVLEELEPQEDAVFTLAKKYLKSKEPTRENLDKLARHLLSKGFSWSDISPVLTKLRSGEYDEGWD